MLTAVLILLISLAVYDAALTAAFKDGSFRDPYKDFTSLEFKGFDTITVNGGGDINVDIMPGDFQVRVSNQYLPIVKVKQKGKELVLDVEYTEELESTNSNVHVVISCPDLVLLNTNAVSTKQGAQHIRNEVLRENMMFNLARRVLVKGMVLDSLVIKQNNGSEVLLQENKIGHLDAMVGLSYASGPRLRVLNGNAITNADLNIQANSELELLDVAIPDLTLKHSNHAKVILSGKSLAALKQ